MVLSKLPVPGRPINLDCEGQGTLSFSLSGRLPDID